MRPVTFRCPRGRLFSFKQKFPAEFSSLIRREFLAHLPVTARKRLFVFQHGRTMRTACRMDIDFCFAVRAFLLRSRSRSCRLLEHFLCQMNRTNFHHYSTNFSLCWEYPVPVFLSFPQIFPILSCFCPSAVLVSITGLSPMDLCPAPFLSQNATAGVKAHAQTAAWRRG